MVRRYVLPCIVIMVVSIGAAGIVNAASDEPRVRTACVFQALIRVGREQPASEDFIKFTNRLATAEVITADFATIYRDVLTQQKLRADDYVVRVVPSGGIASYAVAIVGVARDKTLSLANAICNVFVARIQKQRADRLAADIQTVRNRMPAIQAEVRRLQRIPPSRRTPIDQATLFGQQAALRGNAAEIAALLSLPPSRIAVLSPATAAGPVPVGRSRNYLIALIAGLLACFMYVLVAEVVSGSRRQTAPPWAPEFETLRDPESIARR